MKAPEIIFLVFFVILVGLNILFHILTDKDKN